MAYRAKKRRSSHRRKSHRKGSRRRRMGAVSTGGRRGRLTRVLGGLVGVVGSKYINKIRGVEKLDPKILAAIVIAAGYFAPSVIPARMRSPFVEGIADGLMISGGLSLATEFGVINGIPIVSGWREFNAVNGVEDTRKVTHKELIDHANTEVYRPSVSQVMNGYYNRRHPDGRR